MVQDKVTEKQTRLFVDCVYLPKLGRIQYRINPITSFSIVLVGIIGMVVVFSIKDLPIWARVIIGVFLIGPLLLLTKAIHPLVQQLNMQVKPQDTCENVKYSKYNPSLQRQKPIIEKIEKHVVMI